MILEGNLLNLALEEITTALNKEPGLKIPSYFLTHLVDAMRVNSHKRRFFRKNLRVMEIPGEYPYRYEDTDQWLSSGQLVVALFHCHRTVPPKFIFFHLCRLAFKEDIFYEIDDKRFSDVKFLVLTKMTRYVEDRIVFTYLGFTEEASAWKTEVFDPTEIDRQLKLNHRDRPYLEV